MAPSCHCESSIGRRPTLVRRARALPPPKARLSTGYGGGDARRRACPPFPASQGRMFSPSRFSLLIPIKRRAGAFVALDLCVLRAFFNRRRSAAAFDNGRIRRSVVPPRLMSRGPGQTEARRLQENNVRFFRPNAFRAYFFTDGRQPFVPAASATPACFEPILRFPFFKAERPFVGAHRRAAIQR